MRARFWKRRGSTKKTTKYNFFFFFWGQEGLRPPHALHITFCTACHPYHAMFYFMLLHHFDLLASLACHVYFMLCSILFCLLFEFHFLIHLVPFMHPILVHIFYFFPSFLLIPLFTRGKKRESILESIVISI